MNKQEIEKAISNINYGLHYETCGDMVVITKSAAHQAISALEHQLTNGWIPVSEKLPSKEDNPYRYDYMNFAVTIHDERHLFEQYLVTSSIFCFGDETWNETNVTAWQKLPEPYKEDKNERSNKP